MILELIVRFLGKAITFSFTENVPKYYHFIQKTIEMYHHVEHVFMEIRAQH